MYSLLLALRLCVSQQFSSDDDLGFQPGAAPQETVDSGVTEPGAALQDTVTVAVPREESPDLQLVCVSSIYSIVRICCVCEQLNDANEVRAVANEAESKEAVPDFGPGFGCTANYIQSGASRCASTSPVSKPVSPKYPLTSWVCSLFSVCCSIIFNSQGPQLSPVRETGRIGPPTPHLDELIVPPLDQSQGIALSPHGAVQPQLDFSSPHPMLDFSQQQQFSPALPNNQQSFPPPQPSPTPLLGYSSQASRHPSASPQGQLEFSSQASPYSASAVPHSPLSQIPQSQETSARLDRIEDTLEGIRDRLYEMNACHESLTAIAGHIKRYNESFGILGSADELDSDEGGGGESKLREECERVQLPETEDSHLWFTKTEYFIRKQIVFRQRQFKRAERFRKRCDRYVFCFANI